MHRHPLAPVAVNALAVDVFCDPPTDCQLGFQCFFSSPCSCTCVPDDGPLLRRPCSTDAQCPPGQVCFDGESWCGFCINHHQPTKGSMSAVVPTTRKVKRNVHYNQLTEAGLVTKEGAMLLYSTQDMAWTLVLGFAMGLGLAFLLSSLR
ncbi:Aste57867_82 [Aphanomyces stellatus]|uniref:Aste57867_82 protein n=1 Tax=Aphanomyces stellatus TaxID=120398 RepID=A0A485K2Y4_9STRA|nr:hypothetical protein As57867_000082 [Aphanomyces stellatus]VFT77308.1 Aste57867_82 [Aphanomyces stellatus]